MKQMLCAVAILIPCLVLAGPLDDANSLLAAKAYDKALLLYVKLADAGNPEAQFRLGEMYWYGDGTAPDVKLAGDWMQRAATGGHAGAIDALAMMKTHASRMKDIAYWTSGYKGEELVSGRFNCVIPVIPEKSTTGPDIKSVTKAYKSWQECYNGFVANLQSSPLDATRIPAGVAAVMTPREAQQAQAHLNTVFNGIIAQASQNATATSSALTNWQTATEAQVVADNKGRQLKWDQVREANLTFQTLVVPNQRDQPPKIPMSTR